MGAPWKPIIKDAEDTANFDFDTSCGPAPDDEPFSHDNDECDNGNQFYGFTFRRFLTNGGPPPQFFQGENSSSRSSSGTSNSNKAQNDNNAEVGQDAVYV